MAKIIAMGMAWHGMALRSNHSGGRPDLKRLVPRYAGRKYIAAVTDGANDDRIARIIQQLLAQAADADIDAAVEGR
jgi:hypothetical protein